MRKILVLFLFLSLILILSYPYLLQKTPAITTRTIETVRMTDMNTDTTVPKENTQQPSVTVRPPVLQQLFVPKLRVSAPAAVPEMELLIPKEPEENNELPVADATAWLKIIGKVGISHDEKKLYIKNTRTNRLISIALNGRQNSDAYLFEENEKEYILVYNGEKVRIAK